MKVTVSLLTFLVAVACAQERDPFSGPSKKKAVELTQCAKGHKALKDIPVIYGHVGRLMSTPEIRTKAEHGEILFGGCLSGDREHWVVCETCGLRYDDDHDAWLESHPPHPMSPHGKNNPPCSLDTFKSTLSDGILEIALKLVSDKPSHLSCSRWLNLNEFVGEQAEVISKEKESLLVQQLHTWIKDNGGPNQHTAERVEIDSKIWEWKSKDKLFIVELSPSGQDALFITIGWHRKMENQPDPGE